MQDYDLMYEYAWVIEQDLTNVITYWKGFGFSSDDMKAIRFSRQEDALRVVDALFRDEQVTVTHHSWDKPPQ